MLGSLAVEPIEDNSLTQFLRSLTNFMGTTGESTFGTGSNILQAGLGITKAGLQTISGDPLTYWTRLLSGDQQAITEAMAPEAAAISSQYGAAERSASMLPRGGFRSATLAELPFQKATAIGNEALKLRPEAAKQVTEIGKLLSAFGISVGDLGLGEQGIGQGLLGQTLQGLLARRGQNIQETGNVMNMIGQISMGLGDMIAGIVGGGGGTTVTGGSAG
jgi:hypothetical protein